jgi:ribonuclease Z
VYAERLEHGIECFGYRVVEHDRPGRFLADKAAVDGIPPGPIFRELKAGKTVRLPDGRTVHGSDYVGPRIRGRKLAILGDTRYCDAAIRLAKDVDVLVHEATFTSTEAHLAEAYFHSTAEQAATVAQKAGAHALILSHISARYQGDESSVLLKEAQHIFPNTYIAADFWSYAVVRSSNKSTHV